MEKQSSALDYEGYKKNHSLILDSKKKKVRRKLFVWPYILFPGNRNANLVIIRFHNGPSYSRSCFLSPWMKRESSDVNLLVMRLLSDPPPAASPPLTPKTRVAAGTLAQMLPAHHTTPAAVPTVPARALRLLAL